MTGYDMIILLYSTLDNTGGALQSVTEGTILVQHRILVTVLSYIKWQVYTPGILTGLAVDVVN